MSKRKIILATLIPLLILVGAVAFKLWAGEEIVAFPENPVAVATASPSTVKVGQSVSFDGSGSKDMDTKITWEEKNGKKYNFKRKLIAGVVEKWEWKFGDGGSGSGQSTSHAYSLEALMSALRGVGAVPVRFVPTEYLGYYQGGKIYINDQYQDNPAAADAVYEHEYYHHTHPETTTQREEYEATKKAVEKWMKHKKQKRIEASYSVTLAITADHSETASTSTGVTVYKELSKEDLTDPELDRWAESAEKSTLWKKIREAYPELPQGEAP